MTTAFAGVLAVGGALAAAPAAGPAGASGAKVLLVGSYQGKQGRYSSIQAAVDAARPGDWILVGPGDYHENADETGHLADPSHGGFGGVLVTTPDIHIRGMNRNSVVVDGTKAGSPQCSSAPSDQDLGVVDDGKPMGRNGIVVYRSNGDTVQNLTVCNFLAGSYDSGNEIWWNGGADTGVIGLHGYQGGYLTATSTYYGGEATAAQYGIFSSDASHGRWNQVYASNFNDSGMYVGACQQRCDMTVDHAWMEFSALGYSGTNSGGRFLIEHSRFDRNEDGFDTNTQIDGDPPAPQNGACPGGKISPVTGTTSCWVLRDNVFEDNNNPNVPAAGSASNGPTGTGMSLSGGTNDTVEDNLFRDNGAWGVLVVPYPDTGKPVDGQTCAGTGGIDESGLGLGCVYDPKGNHVLGNRFRHNGFFGNPKNVDIAQLTIGSGEPRNCYAGNLSTDGEAPSTAPVGLQKKQPTCGPDTTEAEAPPTLLAQVICDAHFGSCPPGSHYPQQTEVVMHRLPKTLPTMPDPCKGVPANRWCPG